MLIISLLLAYRLRMSGVVPQFPLCIFTTWTQKTLPFTLFSEEKKVKVCIPHLRVCVCLPHFKFSIIWHNTLQFWIKRNQLDVTCFFISLFDAQRVSDVNTSILRSLRLICWVMSWVILLWYDVCWCYVVVWLEWCGIRMQVSTCIRIPHHRKCSCH
jgi:hypothetical protein